VTTLPAGWPPAGYAYDAERGLYYFSARYYDPSTRQWTTGDPAKADGEESAYQYDGGDPVGKVDLSGREGGWDSSPYFRWVRGMVVGTGKYMTNSDKWYQYWRYRRSP